MTRYTTGQLLEPRTWWPWLTTGSHADAIAALAAIAAGVVAIYTLGFAYRTKHRDTVRAALLEFTSSELAAARDRVAAATRLSGRLSRRRLETLRHDVYTLMWAIERMVAVRSAADTSLATHETQLLYEHIDIVVIELQSAIDSYPKLGCFHPSVDRVNNVLESLPDARRSWRKIRGSAPSERIVCSHDEH